MAERDDSVDLICSVGELSGLFSKSRDLGGFLQQVVEMVAAHMHADVCSVYLYDDHAQALILRATRGLNPASVGKARLQLGEGITGTAVKELRPIREDDGAQNPVFKFIPGTEEEKYASFLAVPIVQGITRIGALVVQTVRKGAFEEKDTKAMRAIASQLAGTIEQVRTLMSLHDDELAPTSASRSGSAEIPEFYKGRSASEGIARGEASIYGRLPADTIGHNIDPDRASQLGPADFDDALKRTEEELETLETDMKTKMSDVAPGMIFSAHLLMLKDENFSGAIRQAIEEGTDVVTAVRTVVDDFLDMFASSPNPRIQEKCQDIQDLGVRLLENMVPEQTASNHHAGSIVIAENLLPSDILKLSAQRTAGVVLTKGGSTAHLAILARTLEIPMVILEDERVLRVEEGADVLVDANQGTVHINPDSEVVERYRELETVEEDLNQIAESVRPASYTSDGVRVHILSNVNLLSEVKLLHKVDSDGVGLYRSEFPYLMRNDFPSEEEQYRIYRKLVEEVDGKPVTFRTLDVGGDKMLPYFHFANEDNPFLGLRSMRFLLQNPVVFTQQLRAFLRAGAGADIGIMFPLVAGVDDFVQAKDMVDECIRQLKAEGIEYNQKPRLGAMIELPSVAAVAEEVAAHADFLSLGTNDLVQYVLGVDRTNSVVAEYYMNHHPGVLRVVNRVVTAAKKAGKEVSICGDMASDPRLIPFLIGTGIRTFSLDPRKMPAVQQQISQLDSREAEKLAQRLLACATSAEVEDILA